MKKICIAIISIALIIAFGISLNNVEKTELQSTDGRDFEKAMVTEIVSSDYSDSTSKDYDGSVGEDGSVRAGQQQIKVKIRTGEHKGEILDATSSSSYLYGARCRIGTKVIVIISESDELTTVSVYNYDRGNQLYMIIAFFLIVLVLIGGLKGFKSAVGLVFTFCCILFVFMPLIYRGVSPIFAAAFVVIITTVVVMYLIDGFTAKSICAIVGTIIGVVLAAVFAFIFGKICHISGYNVDDIESLIYIGEMTDIKVGELMFAGILISALGAVMDVAMSIASALTEVHTVAPQMNAKELFRSGMNIGRDMVGTMTNTLILAFLGSGFALVIYLYSLSLSPHQLISSSYLAIEVVSGISSSIGVILSVPLTALITSLLLGGKKTAPLVK